IWLKPFLLQYWNGNRSRQELGECIGGIRRFSANADSCREYSHTCELARQRTHQLRSFYGYDFRSLTDSQLGLVLGDNFCCEHVPQQHRLCFQLLTNTEAIKNPSEMYAADAP